MGGMIFVLVMISIVVRIVSGAVKSGEKTQKRVDIIGRLTPEQRAQMEKLRQTVRGGQGMASINMPRAADLTGASAPAPTWDDEETEGESLYGGNFYDEEWEQDRDAAEGRAAESQSKARQAASLEHGHSSPDCSFDDQSSYGMPWSSAEGSSAYHDTANAFDSASRGSRLSGNSKWKHKPPLIAPPRPVEAPLFSRHSARAPGHPQDLNHEQATSPTVSAPLTQGEMRKAVVMSEVLKRPRPGVAPRYR